MLFRRTTYDLEYYVAQVLVRIQQGLTYINI